MSKQISGSVAAMALAALLSSPFALAEKSSDANDETEQMSSEQEAAVSANVNDDVKCKRVRRTGSNRISTRCTTRKQRKQEEAYAREELRRTRNEIDNDTMAAERAAAPTPN